MKKSIIFLILIHVISSVIAQYYTYQVTNGQSYMFYFRGSATHILTAPADNLLSGWQKLPFTFDFFGREVNGYFISDNGYLTFGQDEKVSKIPQTSLNDTFAPSNSIYAFWNDFYLSTDGSLWSNEIATATIGTNPERIHIIYWMRVVPSGKTYNHDNVSFAVALYEKGGFDIVYTLTVLSSALTGTVGAKNSDGSEILEIAGSPFYPFPPDLGFGDADDVCIKVRKFSDLTEKTSSKNFYKVWLKGDKLIINSGEMCQKLTIYNPLGQIVYQETLFSESSEIPIKTFRRGIYLLRLENEKGIINKPLIIP